MALKHRIGFAVFCPRGESFAFACTLCYRSVDFESAMEETYDCATLRCSQNLAIVAASKPNNRLTGLSTWLWNIVLVSLCFAHVVSHSRLHVLCATEACTSSLHWKKPTIVQHCIVLKTLPNYQNLADCYAPKLVSNTTLILKLKHSHFPCHDEQTQLCTPREFFMQPAAIVCTMKHTYTMFVLYTCCSPLCRFLLHINW